MIHRNLRKQSPYDWYNSKNLSIIEIRNAFNSQPKEVQRKIYTHLLKIECRERAYELIGADETVSYQPLDIEGLQIDKFRNTHNKNKPKDMINHLLNSLLSNYVLNVTLNGFSKLIQNSVDTYTLSLIENLPKFERNILILVDIFQARLEISEPTNKSVSGYLKSYDANKNKIIQQLKRAGYLEIADDLEEVQFSGKYMNTHIREEFKQEVSTLFNTFIDTPQKRFFDDVEIDFTTIKNNIIKELSTELL